MLPLARSGFSALSRLALCAMLFFLHSVMSNSFPNDSTQNGTLHFRSDILELAEDLLGAKRQPKVQVQRRSQFFGESSRLTGEGQVRRTLGKTEQVINIKQEMASFARLPKTREQQEAELEDELRAEFVRVSLKHDMDSSVRFRKKTYSE